MVRFVFLHLFVLETIVTRGRMISANEIFVQMKMVEQGIVPYAIFRRNISEALSSLSPEQQRVVKRKFRKLWRKAYRHSIDKRSLMYRRGKAPSRAEVGRRKVAVYQMLERELS